MNKIYILHYQKYDLSSLEGVGEIVPVMQGSINVESTDTLYRRLETTLDEVTEEDYVVPSGNILVNFLAGTILAKKLRYIQILVWDSKKSKYFKRILEL